MTYKFLVSAIPKERKLGAAAAIYKSGLAKSRKEALDIVNRAPCEISYFKEFYYQEINLHHAKDFVSVERTESEEKTKKDLEIFMAHAWYNSLSTEEKSYIDLLIKISVPTAH